MELPQTGTRSREGQLSGMFEGFFKNTSGVQFSKKNYEAANGGGRVPVHTDDIERFSEKDLTVSSRFLNGSISGPLMNNGWSDVS